jgi:hypothetical protein
MLILQNAVWSAESMLRLKRRCADFSGSNSK